MAEADIRRFSRQILLREVGGRGQQQLLATPITIDAEWSDAVEAAVTYLTAGGSPVHLVRRAGPSRGFLHGTPIDRSTAEEGALILGSTSTAHVALGRLVACRTHTTCEACWALTVASTTGQPASPVAAGALAALLIQRQVLGFADEFALFDWREGAFVKIAPPSCPAH